MMPGHRPRMFEYRYRDDTETCITVISSPTLEEWESEKRFLSKWYKTYFDRTYGRWALHLQISKYYSMKECRRDCWFHEEWDKFYLFGIYIPFLKVHLTGSLMRMHRRSKVYPVERYKYVVSEDRDTGMSCCHRDGIQCAVCGTPCGYLPTHWEQWGTWWEADFCKDHTELDLLYGDE